MTELVTTMANDRKKAKSHSETASMPRPAGDRDGLANAAGLFGLGQLSDDLKAGKKVDGPRCAVSAHGHAGEQGVIVVDWRAYSCNGMTGAWKADLTVTMHRAKMGLRGRSEYTGEVLVVPIGIPD